MPILILLLLGTAIEITVLILIGNVIGLLPTLALVVLATVLGVVLLRREGMKAVTAFQAKIRSGQQPQAEMLDGVMIAVAGVLVVLPGFVSDLLAIALLFPPTRAVIRKGVLKRAEARASQHRQGQIFIVDAQQ